MGGSTLSTSETRIEALTLQSSAYGVTVTLAYGVTRVPVNLMDYLDFRAVPHTVTQGGKGGVSMSNTTFTYTVNAVMSLGHGPISGVPRIWRDKKMYYGGLEPTQLVTVQEAFTLPASGPMVLTPAHASTLANVLIVEVGADHWTLAPGDHFSLATNGSITVLVDGRRGQSVLVTYQYISGTVNALALQQLGLTFKPGHVAQQPWSALSSFGEHDLGYSGMALLCGQAYKLGTTAQLGNHSAEVIAPLAYHLGSSQPDVDPSLVLRDVLINGRYGAAFPAANLGNWSAWSDWCVAAGLLVSPALTEQQRAADVVAEAARLTNTAPVWTGGQLQMVPYADAAISGNGRTYTPDITPVYELDDDCFEKPLVARIKSPADRKNHLRLEYLDRGNQYNAAIVEAKDQADIDANGLRTGDTQSAHWLKTAAAARLVVQLALQRSLYVPGEYTGTLPWHFCLLDPADLVTVNDPGLGMAQTPLRATVIEEDEAGDLQVTFEDYPAGVAGAARYPAQVPQGYQADYNVLPGNVDAPVIFEAPADLAGSTGLEVYAAVRGQGAAWGGCQVWVSLGGTQ